MTLPAARLGDMTASGDAITGPGAPTVLIGGVPSACLGDAVAGNACTGAIVAGSSTVLIAGRPAARISSSVSGVNPYSGVPVTTTVAKGEATVLIGG